MKHLHPQYRRDNVPVNIIKFSTALVGRNGENVPISYNTVTLVDNIQFEPEKMSHNIWLIVCTFTRPHSADCC